MLPKPETSRPMKRSRKSRWRRNGVKSTVAKRHHSRRLSGSGSIIRSIFAGLQPPTRRRLRRGRPPHSVGRREPGYAEDVMEKATFAGGCFWGVEHLFNEIPGVTDAVSGYTGGTRDNPTYEQVCSGRTGHAEAVEVTYDPAKVTYDQLLNAFWNMHDPTTLNYQGPDHGHQYRSAIFFHNPEQEAAARRSAAEAQKYFKHPIVTEIVPATHIWRAEEYHQRYFDKHQGHSSCHFIRRWVPSEPAQAGTTS